MVVRTQTATLALRTPPRCPSSSARNKQRCASFVSDRGPRLSSRPFSFSLTLSTTVPGERSDRQKSPFVPDFTADREQIRRFWGCWNPLFSRSQLNADFFNRLVCSRKFGYRPLTREYCEYYYVRCTVFVSGHGPELANDFLMAMLLHLGTETA